MTKKVKKKKINLLEDFSILETECRHGRLQVYCLYSLQVPLFVFKASGAHYYELIYSRSIQHTPSMLSLTNTITSYMGSLQRHNGSLRTYTVAYLPISEEKHFNKAF